MKDPVRIKEIEQRGPKGDDPKCKHGTCGSFLL